ncbi:MAG: polyphenol oxidase family protein [Acidobacteriota bacterium]
MTENPDSDGVVEVLLDGALALFADRTAATSDGSPAALAEDARAAASRWVGRPLPALYGRQEHTTLTFVYGAEGPLAPCAHLVGRCDALITAEADIALTVRTADCLPIVLAGGGVVAMIHAGWRGLAGGILDAVTRRIAVDFAVAAADLAAVIGVGVGPCHYRVGTDVVTALAGWPVATGAWQGEGSVDLARWASARLSSLGLPDEEIRVLPGCTACSDRHYSYRRDGANAGRQWSTVLRLGA